MPDAGNVLDDSGEPPEPEPPEPEQPEPPEPDEPDAGPTPDCAVGETRCDGQVVETCDALGSYVPGESCDFVCSQGACSGECVPGAMRCSDTGDVETCDAAGSFVVTTDCAQTCVSNTCSCGPAYAADGASCVALDFCAPEFGGCAPDASCSQSGIAPACSCEAGYAGSGLECHEPATLRLDEGFEDISLLASRGWLQQLNSAPLGITGWFQGPGVPGGPFDAYDGAADNFIGANYNSTTDGNGTISTWLATPELEFGTEAAFSFYTRSPTPSAGGTEYPDRLEVRLCRGEVCALPTGSATTTSNYAKLLVSVNPELTAGVYPKTWTKFSVPSSDLPTSGKGRIAFRYHVTQAGPTGSNSDYIGIDRVQFSASAPAYEVSGTVSGLDGSGLRLSLNGFPALAFESNGDFVLPSKLSDGTPYRVYVYGTPAGQTCSLGNASGEISGANVSNVQVVCSAQ